MILAARRPPRSRRILGADQLRRNTGARSQTPSQFISRNAVGCASMIHAADLRICEHVDHDFAERLCIDWVPNLGVGKETGSPAFHFWTTLSSMEFVPPSRANPSTRANRSTIAEDVIDITVFSAQTLVFP